MELINESIVKYSYLFFKYPYLNYLFINWFSKIFVLLLTIYKLVQSILWNKDYMSKVRCIKQQFILYFYIAS